MKIETIDRANRLIKEISLTEGIQEQLEDVRILEFKNNNGNHLFRIYLLDKKSNTSRIDVMFTNIAESLIRRLKDGAKLTKLQLQLEIDNLHDDTISEELLEEEEL